MPLTLPHDLLQKKVPQKVNLGDKLSTDPLSLGTVKLCSHNGHSLMQTKDLKNDSA